MRKGTNELYCKICGKSSNDDCHFYPKMKLCNKHYLQIKRHGNTLPLNHERQKNNHKCDICGDESSNRYTTWNRDDEYKGKTLCGKHYKQLREHNRITDDMPSQKNMKRICCICESTDSIIYFPKYKGMYCQKHYSQLRIFGKIIPHTVFDRNEYKIVGDITYIYLENAKHEPTGTVLIDTEDLDRVIKLKWNLGTWGYAEATNGKDSVLMQRYILNEYDNERIPDHINRNRLDNRKSNFRITDKSGNAINAGIRTNNTSGITGVSFIKRTQMYRSYINYKGNRIELGSYKNIKDAIKIRLEYELEYYGEYAPQKELFKEYGIGDTI